MDNPSDAEIQKWKDMLLKDSINLGEHSMSFAEYPDQWNSPTAHNSIRNMEPLYSPTSDSIRPAGPKRSRMF